MIPKEIQAKAVEGGWRMNNSDDSDHEIVLSPTFWQALGKSLGWEGKRRAMGKVQESWLGYAQIFIKLILTGGDTQKFWDDLLGNK